MYNKHLWPALPYNEWKDTLEALHMKMQVVGKVKLELSPFLNQWWHVAFHLNVAGMTTGLIPYRDSVFEINFDFNKHTLFIRTSDDLQREVPLAGCSVAEFYGEFMDSLKSLGIDIKINTLPAEVANPVHCYEDHRNAYDKEYVNRWWILQLQASKIFEIFRSGFRGKSSPVHFYWGSFDLSHVRYCGKLVMPPAEGGKIMKYSENEENFAIGFWPGNENYGQPAFYSYLYPAPKGIESAAISPKEAAFNTGLGEFIFNYDDVRKSEFPGMVVSDFLDSTYEASAKLAGWDIKSLKAEIPC
jgi:uncharacterized protein DUF5996